MAVILLDRVKSKQSIRKSSWIATPDRLDELEALSISKDCVGLAMKMKIVMRPT